MKNFLLLCFLTIPFLVFGLLERISVDNYYESNIISLSEHLQDEFLDSERPEKYGINSVDDWVTAVSISISRRHFVKGHTQIIRFTGSYSKYWNNSIKDTGFMGISLRQFFSRQFNIAVFYYYYLDNYVDHYRSVLYPDDYNAFSYSRNNYFTIWSLKISNPVELRYRFDFDQVYHNQYFTEYDAENFTQKLESRVQLSPKIRLNAAYGYRISNARAEKAYRNTAITDFKDPSYTMNRYDAGISIAELVAGTQVDISFYYDEKYFASPFLDNSYHYSRDEFIKRVRMSFTNRISKNWQLQPTFEYQFRTVRSPFSFVTRDKDYENWKAGIQITYYP